MRTFAIEADDGVNLTAIEWRPDGAIKALVQIAHGASEYVGRYDRLAQKLVRSGYACIGSDHRGHGKNHGSGGLGDFGPRGFSGVVDDMKNVAETGRLHFPDTPIILLGHSLGSMAAQIYVKRYSDTLDGLVLSGTAIVQVPADGAEIPSDLRSFNAAFEPTRTPLDWLSRDEAEIDAYIADPLCGFMLPPQSLTSIVDVMIDTYDGMSAKIGKPFPIYVISGELDPIVGPDQCMSRALVDHYIEAGFNDVQHRIYPGGRHEMFNEINRDEVMSDLVAWLDEHF